MEKTLRLTSVAVALVLLLLDGSVFASDITLTLIPATGDVSGSAGSTVGWGYTISNNTPNWLEPLSLSAGSFSDGTPNLIFNYPDIGPNSSVAEDFSLVTTPSCSSPPCGLYEFAWASNAPAGTVNSGAFVVSSDYFSGNPANPTSTDLGAAPDASADYSASVSSAVTVTPEPGTLLLLVTGIWGLSAFERRGPAKRRTCGNGQN
jgi:hypothetical protein